MNFEDLTQLLRFMEEHNLVEAEYEVNGKRIRLRKAESHSVPLISSLAIPEQKVSSPSSKPTETATFSKEDNLVEFKSPLVGTFYRAPKPDAEPFVHEGDEITSEKVLCIIEAMKVMNEIKAEMNGTLRQIIAKNGQAVEYGEPLFLIEKR